REMARTPNQTGIGIHANSIRRAANVTERDLAQHIRNRSSAFIDEHRVEIFLQQGSGLFANHIKPQWRVARVAIGSVVAMNRVWHRAVLDEAPERDEQFSDVADQTGSEQTARGD